MIFLVPIAYADDYEDLEPAANRVEEILASLNSVLGQGDRLEGELDALIARSVDEQMILRRVLGPDWAKIDAQEQNDLMLAVRQYVSAQLRRFLGSPGSLEPALLGRERIRDLRSASISVQLKSQPKVLVKLFERDEVWWVYDLEWATGSMLRQLRAAMAKRFQHDGSAGALQVLQAHSALPASQ